MTAARRVTQLSLLKHLNAPIVDEDTAAYDEKYPPLLVICGPIASKKLIFLLEFFSEHSTKVKLFIRFTTSWLLKTICVEFYIVFSDKSKQNLHDLQTLRYRLQQQFVRLQV